MLRRYVTRWLKRALIFSNEDDRHVASQHDLRVIKDYGLNGTKLNQKPTPPVIPAKAGIQRNGDIGGLWIPAFAGKTVVFDLSSCHSTMV